MLATQNVNVTIARDTSIRSGTDRVKHLAMVAALNPVQPGSSISHWDTAGIPNQLMEPSISADLTASVRAAGRSDVLADDGHRLVLGR
jgi:hypothetical protein